MLINPLSLSLSLAQAPVFPQVAMWVTIGLAVCLLGLLIALAAVCHRKIKESCEEMRAGKGTPQPDQRTVFQILTFRTFVLFTKEGTISSRELKDTIEWIIETSAGHYSY